MRLFAILILVQLGWSAYAYEPGSFFIDPRVAVGVNPAQGTHFIAGLDVGYAFDEHFSMGVGGYYSAGEMPKHDREYGVGPFASYVYPIASFLTGFARQEFNSVNLRDPAKTVTAAGTTYTHTEETGVASVTSVGVHVSLVRLVGFAVGYRQVVGLTNSDLGDGRSGIFFGFSIGI